jgi:hydroxyacylglutathione hydrolase
MLLRYFYDTYLAQASYLIGCQKTGEAIVVDPARNIDPYLAVAKEEGLRITHAAETHIHADFVSGIAELAAHNAQIYLSQTGGPDWQYGYPAYTPLADTSVIKVGNVLLQALHTPGHTPEHLSFLLTDGAQANKPMLLLTGDFIFVGDVGRPDLLETAAGVVGSKWQGAQNQFASLQKITPQPDYLQILPGHGAGSACGKALGAVPSSSLGYERLFNPAFQFSDSDTFAAWLLEGQPETPSYFAQMKRVNKAGPALLKAVASPAHTDAATLGQFREKGGLLLDFRDRAAFVNNHLEGAINFPASSRSFLGYLGSLIGYDKPLALIVTDEGDLPEILACLRSIGHDQTPFYITASGLPTGQTLPQMSATDLSGHQLAYTLVDVRTASEYAEDHLASALHIPLAALPNSLDQLPPDEPLILHCASGFRAQIAASWLRANGYRNAIALSDAKAVWLKHLR